MKNHSSLAAGWLQQKLSVILWIITDEFIGSHQALCCHVSTLINRTPTALTKRHDNWTARNGLSFAKHKLQSTINIHFPAK
jgi:hypothetical protein